MNVVPLLNWSPLQVVSKHTPTFFNVVHPHCTPHMLQALVCVTFRLDAVKLHGSVRRAGILSTNLTRRGALHSCQPFQTANDWKGKGNSADPLNPRSNPAQIQLGFRQNDLLHAALIWNNQVFSISTSISSDHKIIHEFSRVQLNLMNWMPWLLCLSSLVFDFIWSLNAFGLTTGSYHTHFTTAASFKLTLFLLTCYLLMLSFSLWPDRCRWKLVCCMWMCSLRGANRLTGWQVKRAWRFNPSPLHSNSASQHGR